MFCNKGIMNEQKRLLEHRKRKKNWKKWGPYLSERAWGTVREDYGKGTSPWNAFSFDEAHKRVYRWGEDGLGGFCDRGQYVCMGIALWNGKDPILKERMFGLSSEEGNHGEDVKELYYYLDATPTSSYTKMLYKYPHGAFPYENLREENKKRGLEHGEYEILDTGIFAEDRYFDVLIEYAKEEVDEIVCRISVTNRGKESAAVTVLPQIWFRNTWRWGYENGPTGDDGGKPELWQEEDGIALKHPVLGQYHYHTDEPGEFLFCDNDEKVPYPKDAIGRHVIEGGDVNPEMRGTKAAAKFQWTLASGEKRVLRLRLAPKKGKIHPKIFEKMEKQTDDFYDSIQEEHCSEEMKSLQRRAFAGMLFSKQFYYLDQTQWLKGDPNYPASHSEVRNERWEHLTAFDVLSMPDNWEYPYFCAWDSAFHCLPLVLIDPDYAKRHLTLMTREWYMHPDGQFPAYEWSFSDVNPPIHAWALWRTYKIDAKKYGKEDRAFLEGNFHKLLLNFTWWVNKKDEEGNNVFQGGFLGMDNISVFDRSSTLPTGGHIDQSDGSAWMTFYCINLMKISLHLAEDDAIYQDMATKFFEHFLRISAAMTRSDHHSLWNEEDGFFYDILHLPSNEMIPLKVRSLVGLLPLLAVETVEPDTLEKMPVFKRRMDWFISKRPDVSFNLACIREGGTKDRRLLSVVTKEQLISILKYMLDEEEFLSPHGIRSISKYHEKNPYVFKANDHPYEVKYVPGESDNRMFGGNSNWRGPVWFPINFLLIEALQRFHHYYGDELKVEFPTGSGNHLNLWDVSIELSKRLIGIYQKDGEGKSPVFGEQTFHDHPLFFEYFHGDTGMGLGASHQTGWTGLIAKLIQQSGKHL
ncbi:MAG: glucosidase [Simkaniaceae bacterium]|nr:glucosidase [Candidatus Sacchlamyda saccharinae]